MRPAFVFGIATGDAPIRHLSFFPLSLVTVPEVFVNVRPSSFSFQKWQMATKLQAITTLTTTNRR